MPTRPSPGLESKGRSPWAPDELNAVVDAFELTVTDRRKRDGLIDVIAASKKAILGEVLSLLPRERLNYLGEESPISFHA